MNQPNHNSIKKIYKKHKCIKILYYHVVFDMILPPAVKICPISEIRTMLWHSLKCAELLGVFQKHYCTCSYSRTLICWTRWSNKSLMFLVFIYMYILYRTVLCSPQLHNIHVPKKLLPVCRVSFREFHSSTTEVTLIVTCQMLLLLQWFMQRSFQHFIIIHSVILWIEKKMQLCRAIHRWNRDKINPKYIYR